MIWYLYIYIYIIYGGKFSRIHFATFLANSQLSMEGYIWKKQDMTKNLAIARERHQFLAMMVKCPKKLTSGSQITIVPINKVYGAIIFGRGTSTGWVWWSLWKIMGLATLCEIMEQSRLARNVLVWSFVEMNGKKPIASIIPPSPWHLAVPHASGRVEAFGSLPRSQDWCSRSGLVQRPNSSNHIISLSKGKWYFCFPAIID